MGALLACAPAVASHWTAAWLLGLAQYQPETFALTVPSRRGHRRREFFVHYARLPEADLADADGIPVTSMERTHLDIAARWPDSVSTLLERSEESKCFDLRRFESLLARTSGHPGHGPLTKALRIYRPDPTVVRSKLERRFRALVRASSLPLPSRNVIVGRYELGLPLARPPLLLRTRHLRHSRVAPLEVERVTDLQLAHEPEEVLAALAEALGRHRP